MFNIIETSVSPGGTFHWEGSGFTPNDTIAVTVCFQGILGSGCQSGGSYDSGPNGSFTGSDQVPADAPPGTASFQLTDSHGKSASDSFQIQ
jgi:hypothetical protein